MKKKLLFLVAVFTLFVPSVLAAELTASTDAELINAFATAASGDTIKLTANIENHKGGSSSLMVNGGRNITLDLNGHNITVEPSLVEGTKNPVNKSIVIEDGTLTIKGKGTIKHETHVAVNVWASSTETSDPFSTLTVEKDVTLEGNTGISVFYGTTTKSYGGVVNFSGKINATENGITINGYIKDTTNAPVINIKNGANITSVGNDGVGLYGAGNGTWNIENGVTVVGEGSALGIKAGTFNIKGGTFTATGEYVGSPELYGNGINPSGSTIQIETNSASYYGHVNLNIEGGTFTSKKGATLLEYGSRTDTAVEAIEITGGEFNSAGEVGNLVVSNGLKTNQENRNAISISGGVFSNEISDDFLSEDSITISFAAIIDKEVQDLTNEVGVIVVPAGTKLDDEAIAELKALIGEVEEGYKLEGFYTDSEAKTKLDLSKEFTENTTIYINMVKETVKEEKNPATNDMNLALILASLGLASAGAVLVSRKKLAKANR